jgi:hypothetical protein
VPDQAKHLDTVALTADLPEHNLSRGQVGTVVETLAPGVFEVEFSDGDGRTYALLSLRAEQLMVLHYNHRSPSRRFPVSLGSFRVVLNELQNFCGQLVRAQHSIGEGGPNYNPFVAQHHVRFVEFPSRFVVILMNQLGQIKAVYFALLPIVKGVMQLFQFCSELAFIRYG